MAMMTYSHLFKFLTLGLFLKVLLGLGLSAQAQSQLENRSAAPTERIVFDQDFDPPGDGAPKDTSGAGSRDGLKCSQDEQSIRPLMPKRNYGLTLEERPPVFIDLAKTSAKQVVLTFRDEAGKSYERAYLPISDRTGVASFTLPNEKPALAVGKNYQWSLVVVCGETVQPDDPVFRGWVQRVARTPALETELGQKSVIEQAAWYGAKGYWYDLLRVMAQARRSHPDDLKLAALWRELLESVGLRAIASEPLLPGD